MAIVGIDLEEVEVEEPRQVGAVHVGHQIWQRLGLAHILAGVGSSPKTWQAVETDRHCVLIAPILRWGPHRDAGRSRRPRVPRLPLM